MNLSPLYRLFAVILFLLVSPRAFSQDKIVRSNNDTIRAKIIEITVDKIKFHYSSVKDGPVLEISKNLVKEIIYENGTKLNIVYNPYEVSQDLLIHERSNAIKVDILAPVFNHYTIGFEHKLKKGTNVELKASLIATNLNNNLKYAEGYFIRLGVKFIKLTDSYQKGLKYVHPFKGGYIKPELIFGQFKRDEEHVMVPYTNFVADVIFGNQYLINKNILIDYFGGAGFGIQNSPNDSDFSYAYSHLFFGKKIPLIITGGLMVGLVF